MASRPLISTLEKMLERLERQCALAEAQQQVLCRMEAAVTSTMADIERNLFGQTIAMVMEARMDLAAQEPEIEGAIEAFDRLCGRSPQRRHR